MYFVLFLLFFLIFSLLLQIFHLLLLFQNTCFCWTANIQNPSTQCWTRWVSWGVPKREWRIPPLFSQCYTYLQHSSGSAGSLFNILATLCNGVVNCQRYATSHLQHSFTSCICVRVCTFMLLSPAPEITCDKKKKSRLFLILMTYLFSTLRKNLIK